MRTLLVFIVVINLLYAGWEWLSPVKQAGRTASLPSGLKTLELLNEDKINLLKELTKDEQTKSEGEAGGSQSDTSIAANEIEAVNSDAMGSGAMGSGATAAQINADVNKKLKTCYTLGPFKDENIMQQLRASIAQYVTNISVRKRQQPYKHRYWVYVPAQENKKQAKLVSKQLRDKQVNDFYIVLSGAEKYSISLGHFREPSHANRRVKKVGEQGFEVKIKVIYREYDIFWLDYQVESQGEASGFTADEYVSDGVSQLERDCSN